MAEHGEAWPCSEAFSGCYCNHIGDYLVLSDSSVHFFLPLFSDSPRRLTKDSSLRKCAYKPINHELGSFQKDFHQGHKVQELFIINIAVHLNDHLQ